VSVVLLCCVVLVFGGGDVWVVWVVGVVFLWVGCVFFFFFWGGGGGGGGRGTFSPCPQYVEVTMHPVHFQGFNSMKGYA